MSFSSHTGVEPDHQRRVWRAGVWRAKAIRAAGGWNSRTTVEDMDLSLRAFMAGWAAVYLTDVTVLNEVPKSLLDMAP